MRLSILPVLILLAVPACGGEVLVSETGASSSGSGSGGGTSASTVGVGGSSTSGSTSGVGGAPMCFETHDTLDVMLGTWEGSTYACNAGSGDYEFSATVVDSEPSGFFLLDSCPPNADCVQQLSKLSITAPDLSIYVPNGAFVRVHVSVYPFMGGCAQRVQIKNLPSWGGVPNPFESGGVLWFYGADGDSSGFSDTPIQATTKALGCFPGEPAGCGEHEDYAWHFAPANNLKEPGVVVPMGEMTAWSGYNEGVLESLLFRNLRSYSLGFCDGPVDLAFWMTRYSPLD